VGLEEGAIPFHEEAPVRRVALEGKGEPAGEPDGLPGRFLRQGLHVEGPCGGLVGVLFQGQDHGPRLVHVEARGGEPPGEEEGLPPAGPARDQGEADPQGLQGLHLGPDAGGHPLPAHQGAVHVHEDQADHGLPRAQTSPVWTITASPPIWTL